MTYRPPSSDGYSSESSAPTSAAPPATASSLAVCTASGVVPSFGNVCSCTVQPSVPDGQSGVNVTGAATVATAVASGIAAAGGGVAAALAVGVGVAATATGSSPRAFISTT